MDYRDTIRAHALGIAIAPESQPRYARQSLDRRTAGIDHEVLRMAGQIDWLRQQMAAMERRVHGPAWLQRLTPWFRAAGWLVIVLCGLRAVMG